MIITILIIILLIWYLSWSTEWRPAYEAYPAVTNVKKEYLESYGWLMAGSAYVDFYKWARFWVLYTLSKN